MTKLNQRESELVALGAAMGSNCSPCIEYHIPVARKAGLRDEDIGAAIDLADKVRQVPANKTLNTALEENCDFYRDNDDTLHCDEKG